VVFYLSTETGVNCAFVQFSFVLNCRKKY